MCLDPNLWISTDCLLNCKLLPIKFPIWKGREHCQMWDKVLWLRVCPWADAWLFGELFWNGVFPVGKLICSQFLVPVCADLDIFFSLLLPSLQVNGCWNCSGMLGGALFGHSYQQRCQNSISSFGCGWVYPLEQFFPGRQSYSEPWSSLVPYTALALMLRTRSGWGYCSRTWHLCQWIFEVTLVLLMRLCGSKSKIVL